MAATQKTNLVKTYYDTVQTKQKISEHKEEDGSEVAQDDDCRTGHGKQEKRAYVWMQK